MTRNAGDEDGEEISRAYGLRNRRSRLAESAVRLQMPSIYQPQRLIHQLQTVQQPPVSDPDLSFAEAFDDAGGDVPVTLTDLDILDCPICVHPLHSPIYQCENGHIACSSCCVKVKNKCSSCCSPIGFIRCRVLENLTESLKIECQNSQFGCKETLIYHKKAEHETTCPHTACFCPISSCNFSGSSKILYNHFTSTHSSLSATSFTYNNTFALCVGLSQKHVILQEKNEGVIFILNHDIQENGRLFNVDCIGPSTFTNAFVYQLSVKDKMTCLSLETIPEVCAKWQEHTPAKTYLTVPSSFSYFFLCVCIKKAN